MQREDEAVLGLPRGTVRLRPYSADWPRLFEAERARLQAAIGWYVLDIQHIGSTSVPGLAAKPILDIGVAVTNFEAAAVCIESLVALGYEYLGELGIPRRHYFVKGAPRTHHLHMNEITSDDWQRTIAFRDYLRRHPEAAQEYADLKHALTVCFPEDREAYTNAKSGFIARILQQAQAAASDC